MVKYVAAALVAIQALLPQARPGQDPNQALREAAAKVVTASKTVSSTSDLGAYDKNCEEALRLYYGVGLKDEVRASVKADLVAAWKAARARAIQASQNKTKANPAWRTLLGLRADLLKRRPEALKLIRDEAIYLPEKHPEYLKGDRVNGQARVDELILKRNKGSIQDLWERGLAIQAKPDPAVGKEIDLARRLGDKYLHDLAEDPDEEDLRPVAYFSLLPSGPVNLRSLASTPEEQAVYRWNRAVEKYNSGLQDPSVTAEEKQHARTLNEYREMLGLRALFLDARLCRSAKKHSGVCNAAQKIWHEGSDGTPASRMKAEGFDGDTTGENILIRVPSADSWWQGWYLASDHHRNAIQEIYNCIGYGYQGNVGTENFGKTTPPAGLEPK